MDKIQDWQNEINHNLHSAIDNALSDQEFKDVLLYSVLPAGKLFRPLLVYSLAYDLGEINDAQKNLATSLELHHAYTLIHDDLPAMDDDDIRRGRAATHKKFSQWEAILAGDALISLSFELLSYKPTTKLAELLALYTKNVGANGLILGQVFDLKVKNSTIDDILKIHELKTSRLIQTALSGSNLLALKPIQETDIEMIGKILGISFQLLDDLCELTQPPSPHEEEINPFLKFDQSELLNIVFKNSNDLRSLLDKHNLTMLKTYINTYFLKISEILTKDLEHVNKYVKLDNEQIKKLVL